MFWKKNRPNEPGLLYSYVGACRREAARVAPPPEAPVKIRVDDFQVGLVDVSAGGLAFGCGPFRPGQVLPVAFELPGEETPIRGRLEVVDADDQELCHARFLDLTEEMIEAIHHYALVVQKNEIQKRKLERIET